MLAYFNLIYFHICGLYCIARGAYGKHVFEDLEQLMPQSADRAGADVHAEKVNIAFQVLRQCVLEIYTQW